MSLHLSVNVFNMQGRIPSNLHGTLLRNGPGNYEYGEDVRRHPFDGDGLICSFAFKDGQVLVRQKFVRTEALVQEVTQGALMLPLSLL
jgi:all-trans-8'-apo-beta-carotenal 15,15'-oxygenase